GRSGPEPGGYAADQAAGGIENGDVERTRPGVEPGPAAIWLRGHGQGKRSVECQIGGDEAFGRTRMALREKEIERVCIPVFQTQLVLQRVPIRGAGFGGVEAPEIDHALAVQEYPDIVVPREGDELT